MTAQEKELIEIIRNAKDPAKALITATNLLIAVLQMDNAKGDNE